MQGSGQHGRGPQLRVSEVSSHLSGQFLVTSRVRVSFPLGPHDWLHPSQSLHSSYSHVQGGGGHVGGGGHGSVWCGSQARPPHCASEVIGRVRVLECPSLGGQPCGQVDQSLHSPSSQSSGQQSSSLQGSSSVSFLFSQFPIASRERDFVPSSHDVLQGPQSSHGFHLQHSGGTGFGPGQESWSSSGSGHGFPPYFASVIILHTLDRSPPSQDVLHALHSVQSHIQGLGQSSSSHGSSSVLFPSHSFPPYFASCATSRLRD